VSINKFDLNNLKVYLNICTMTQSSFNGYQFGIEKYLNQLQNNPYINELKEELNETKYNKLKKYVDYNIVSLFNIYLVNEIFNICDTDYKLDYLSLEIKKINTEDISNNQLLRKIETILENVNNISLKNKHNLIPTPLRISTMTVCCSIGCNINTKYLYNSFKEYVDYKNPHYYADNKKYLPTARGIIGCKAENYNTKGVFQKDKKTNFYNSSALNILVKDNKCINVKIFNNGKIQMTGVPDEETGRECIHNYLINYIKSVPDNDTTNEKIVQNKDELMLTDFRIVLINSDYFCGVEIQRENLYYILTEKCNLSVSYESENYPGVKLEYFWNINNIDTTKEGQCCCDIKCKGKGTGLQAINDCKKITISTFQSGKVIITGARSIKQINTAYNYINKVFNLNYDYIAKKTIKNKEKIHTNINHIQHTQFYFLKKSNIKNYQNYQTLSQQ